MFLQFGDPLMVALDAAGNMYVADQENRRVAVLRSVDSATPGSLLFEFLGAPEYFTGVEACTLDAAGNVYVSDENLQNVRAFAGLPAAAGTVLGDPQFRGFLGQSYQVHGMSGGVYSVISAPSLQLNARFVFLAAGGCPGVRRARAAAGDGRQLLVAPGQLLWRCRPPHQRRLQTAD